MNSCLIIYYINQSSVLSFAHGESITTLEEEEFKDIENIRKLIYEVVLHYRDNILRYINAFIHRKVRSKVSVKNLIFY